MTLANKIVDTFIYVVILFLSINTHAEFFEKDESIYFEGSIGSIADIKIAHERNDSWISYILNDSSKDDKWAIITRVTDTIGSRTTESRFLYYYPKKIALHETLHNSDLYRMLKNKNEEYLKTINDGIIYLADLEGEIKKSKYIKLWEHGCSGRYTGYTECGLYLNTKTNNKEWYVKINDIEYSLYDKSIDDIQLGRLKIMPPVAYYIYNEEDGYHKNFWHYPSNTKYIISANRTKKTVSLSHKDFELKESVARHVIKELIKTQIFLESESSSSLIGLYDVSDNLKDLYSLYIYKQDLKLRYFLFDPKGDLEVMGDVLVDSEVVNFINQKPNNNSSEGITIKSDKSLKTIDIKLNNIGKTYTLIRK